MKDWKPEDIRAFRQRFKLTQKELANLIGVSANYVYLLEKGVREPGKPLKLFFECLEENLSYKKQSLPEKGKKVKEREASMEFKIQRIAPNPSGIAIVSCRKETRQNFPSPGKPFILVIDDREYQTSIRNLQKTGWTSFAKTFYRGKRITRAELCELHKLKEGNRVFVEIVEPFKKYTLRR